MDSAAYELFALAMRYVFSALIVLFLMQLIRHCIFEYRIQRRAKELECSTGYLEISAPEELEGQRFPLYQEVTIGASRRCDIVLPKQGLSATHATIYEKKGQLYLADTGGKGGVSINDVRVSKRDELLLNGDRINIGRVEFYLYFGGGEERYETFQ